MHRLSPVLLALAPGLLQAAEGVLPASGPDPLSSGYLVKLTLSLLGVLGLLFLLVALMRRFGGLPRTGRQQEIAVQGSLAVGPRERVVWIEVAGHQLVLGVSNGQIEPLLHLPPEAVDTTAQTSDPLLEVPPIPRSKSKGGFEQTLAEVNIRSDAR
jgi:flagellar protein FliO/FliZ